MLHNSSWAVGESDHPVVHFVRQSPSPAETFIPEASGLVDFGRAHGLSGLIGANLLGELSLLAAKCTFDHRRIFVRQIRG